MKYFKSLFLFFICNTLFGQVDISFRQIEKGVSYLNAWDLVLKNNSNEKLVIILETLITSKESGKVYEARTERFLLVPGTQFITKENLPSINTIFVLPDDNLLFKNENYDIHVRVLDYPGLNVLSSAYFNYLFNQSRFNADTSKQKKKVSFGLVANFTGQLENVFNDTIERNPDFARLHIQPNINIFDVPISAELFLSTDNPEGLFKGTDHYNIKFDYQQFKTTLIQKAYEKLNAISGQKIPQNLAEIDNINKDYWRKMIPNFDSLSALASDPKIMEQLEILKNQEAFKQILENPEIKAKIEKLENVKQKYGLNEQNFKDLSGLFTDFQPQKLEELLEFIPKDSLPFDFKNDNLDTIALGLQKFVQSGDYKKWLDKSALSENAIGLTDKIKFLNKYKDSLKIDNWADLKNMDKMLENFSLADFKQTIDLEKQLKEMEKMVDLEGMDIKQLEKVKKYQADLKKYKQKDFETLLNDPSALKDLDNAFGLLSKKEKILNGFKNLEVGKIYPEFTPMTLAGTRLTGAWVSYENDKFYLSTVAGKADLLTFRTADTLQTGIQDSLIKRSIFGLSGGWGNSTKNFVHANLLFSPAQYASRNNLETSTEKQFSQIVSINFGLNLFKSKYLVYGEIAKSFNNNASFSLDEMAGKANFATQSKKNKLKWESSVEFIGKTYTAFGLPFSITDKLSFETGIQQNFFSNQLNTQLKYKEDQFNVSTANKRYFRTIQIALAYSKPSFPFVQVIYQPIFNNENVAELPAKNFFSNIQLNSSYTFITGKIDHNIQASYNNIFNRSIENRILSNGTVVTEYLDFDLVKVHQVGMRYGIKTKKQVSFQQNFNIILPNNNETERIITDEISSTFPILKKSRNSVGIIYGDGSINGQKIGFFVQTYFPITKYLIFDLRIQNDALHRLETTDNKWKDGILIRSSINFKI